MCLKATDGCACIQSNKNTIRHRPVALMLSDRAHERLRDVLIVNRIRRILARGAKFCFFFSVICSEIVPNGFFKVIRRYHTFFPLKILSQFKMHSRGNGYHHHNGTYDAEEEDDADSVGAFLSDFEAHVDPGLEPETSSAYVEISVPLHDNNNNNSNEKGKEEEGDEEKEEEEEEGEESNRMHVEVGAPERRGEGLNAHIVFGVSYWTTLPTYARKSGFVRRRFSQFNKLYQALVEEVAGVIVPTLPPKTTFPLDDPKSPAIASRATLLRVFIAKISMHPLLSRSKALYDFLDCSKSNTTYNKVKLSTTKDVKKKTTSAISSIFGSVTNVISSINDTIASKTSDGELGGGSHLFDVEGTLREPALHAEVCQYISSLRERTEKMLASAKKVIRHKEKTTEYFSDLSTVFNTMQEHETRGVEIIERISGAAKANWSTASSSSSRQGICWRKAANTFSRIAQSDDTPETTDLKHDRNRLFLEKISGSLQLIMEVVNALAARKKIVDEYNHTLQSIARNQYKISSLGLPDAGPKREEKRRLELKVADYRVKKTTLFKKYETAKSNMENELLWFHTELSKSLGSSLRLFVMTQGAEAGELHRSLLQI